MKYCTYLLLFPLLLHRNAGHISARSISVSDGSQSSLPRPSMTPTRSDRLIAFTQTESNDSYWWITWIDQYGKFKDENKNGGNSVNVTCGFGKSGGYREQRAEGEKVTSESEYILGFEPFCFHHCVFFFFSSSSFCCLRTRTLVENSRSSQ